MSFWGELIIPHNLQDAYQYKWRVFDPEQKSKAIQILHDRIEAREDPRFVTLLPKYLDNGAWMRPPRKESVRETAKEKRDREWIKRMEEK